MLAGLGGPSSAGGGAEPTGSNPFMSAVNQMFKDFEQVSKEGDKPGAGCEPKLDEFLNNFTKDLFAGAAGAEGGASDAAGMDKIMAEFSKFLKESEGNEDMKSALDSVVNELLTKDTLYEPMKTLREEYPVWLETNWDKVSNETLENYNAQLDKITEICGFYESPEGDKPETQSHVFELLAQLQELGSPPDDLMKKIAEK